MIYSRSHKEDIIKTIHNINDHNIITYILYLKNHIINILYYSLIII